VHPFLATGLAQSKFGIDSSQLDDVLDVVASEPRLLRLVGLHCHLGSTIDNVFVFRSVRYNKARFPSNAAQLKPLRNKAQKQEHNKHSERKKCAVKPKFHYADFHSKFRWKSWTQTISTSWDGCDEVRDKSATNSLTLCRSNSPWHCTGKVCGLRRKVGVMEFRLNPADNQTDRQSWKHNLFFFPFGGHNDNGCCWWWWWWRTN